jgi:hypothetical protein
MASLKYAVGYVAVLFLVCIVIAEPDRFAGYSLYVSNSSISKTDGYICYHHKGPGLPSLYQDVNCIHLGQHVTGSAITIHTHYYIVFMEY